MKRLAGRVKKKLKNSYPSLREVAEQARVSTATASRILSGWKPHLFAEATKKRVAKIAQELGYRPNRLVGGVRRGKTQSVGVLIPAYQGFYGELAAGIHDELIMADYVPIILWSKTDSPHGIGKSELEQIHQLVERRVEGVILKPARENISDEYLHEILDRRLPLVVVDRELPHVKTNYVGTDDESGFRRSIDYLHGLGHRVFGYFGIKGQIDTGLHRRRGFHDALAGRKDVLVHEYLCPSSLTYEDKEVIEGVVRLLRSTPRPTAVLAFNDHYAETVYLAAAKMGYAIPKDLSVVGFGRIPVYANLVPSMTSFEQHGHEVGRTAAKLLLSVIRGEVPADATRQILVNPTLVTGDSTGAVPIKTEINPRR